MQSAGGKSYLDMRFQRWPPVPGDRTCRSRKGWRGKLWMVTLGNDTVGGTGLVKNPWAAERGGDARRDEGNSGNSG